MMTYAVRVAAASRAPAASAGESGWPLRVMWPDSASARSPPAQSSARAAHSMKKLGSSGWSIGVTARRLRLVRRVYTDMRDRAFRTAERAPEILADGEQLTGVTGCSQARAASWALAK